MFPALYAIIIWRKNVTEIFQSLKKFQDGTRQKKSSNPDFVFDRKMSFQEKN